MRNVPFSPPDVTEAEIAEVCDALRSGWITTGPRTKEFEKLIAMCCQTHTAVCLNSATACMELILRVLGVGPGDEVITSAYTYTAPASVTCHVGAKVVMIDTAPGSFEMDYDKLADAITERTKVVIPVDLGGVVCDYDSVFAAVESKRHLFRPANEIQKAFGRVVVLADAAHAFGVEKDGVGVLNAGDMSTLSFHATKVFNTIEGGALVVRDAETKKRIDYLKNFGFASETEVVAPGINSKMDEIRSAYGLLNLKQVDRAIAARRNVALQYRERLKDVAGLRFFNDMPGVRHNYSYFPVFVDESEYGMSRDELYFKMRDAGVFGRRYFYPLISTFSTYRGLPSAALSNLPEAHRMADSVICLPMHHELGGEDVERILSLIER